jgi:uracil-DNA glycosylase
MIANSGSRRTCRDEGVTGSAGPFLPLRLSLPALRKAAQDCRGCGLYKCATQAVCGEGRRTSRIMLVGEQPGDQEDLQGRPFVGPAGQMLDKALNEVGIDRDEVYLTNAVKHFKFTSRGKRRIHGKPNAREIRACRPWLDAELEIVQPQLLIALGATAAQALFGPKFRVSVQRGKAIDSPLARWCMATVHPSSLLRAPDAAAKRAAYQAFVQDLRTVAVAFKSLRKPILR